jgi:hypothetical protein
MSDSSKVSWKYTLAGETPVGDMAPGLSRFEKRQGYAVRQ